MCWHIICFLLVLYCVATFCQHVQTSVIVIDKPVGLGGTVYTSSTSIFVSHLCAIYYLNKRFETETIISPK